MANGSEKNNHRPFDWSSLFFAVLSFLDVVQRCRLGDQPSSTMQQDDRGHLRSVIAIMIKLDKVCKEIAEWKGWDYEVYAHMLNNEPKEYKANTNSAYVCFGNSKKRVQRDLGNLWYMFLYYYIHLQNPEFVEELGKLRESLRVNRFPAATEGDLINKGDIIEFGLYRLRNTGWIIPQRERNRNIEMMQKFCEFGDLMHELEMRLARSPILPQSSADKWCNSERAEPEAFAKAIYFCSKLHAEQNDTNLRNAHVAVQLLCTSCTPLEATDPWATMDSALRQHLGWQQCQDPATGKIWWYKREDGRCRCGECRFEPKTCLRIGFMHRATP